MIDSPRSDPPECCRPNLQAKDSQELTMVMDVPTSRWRGPRVTLRIAVFVLLGLTAAGGRFVRAMEPPRPGELEKLRAEGTLASRVAFARATHNHETSPTLARRATTHLRAGLSPGAAVPPQRTPPPAWRDMPTTGNVRVLALMIAFSDYGPNTPADTQASVNASLFGDGDPSRFPYESLRNFYRRSSYGQLEIQGDTLGWYTTPYPRSSVAQTDAGRDAIVKEALSHYDALGYDFSVYDNDGDGAIDYVAVIWSGPNTGWGSFWWSYLATFADASYQVDGKRLSKYSWVEETWEPGDPFAPTTAIHETGHALGLPDYYDYEDGVGPRGGIGGLDMMADSKGDHNCFSKFLLDWISPTVITAGVHNVALHRATTSQDAVLFVQGATGALFDEYFMLQNRARAGNDTELPADGMVIWHVDAHLDGAGDNFLYNNSNTDHKLLRLMEADGLEEIEAGAAADAGDFYRPGFTLSSSTTPSNARYDLAANRLSVTDVSAPGDPMTAVVGELDDATPPTGAPTTPTDQGSVTTSPKLAFAWTRGTAADPESGISGYHLQVGTSRGAADFFDQIVGSALSYEIPGAKHGRTYYARVRAINKVGLAGAWSGSSDGIRANLPPLSCEALDACPREFDLRGNASWFTQSAETAHGPTAGQSGPITHGQTSTVRTFASGPATLGFSWKISSEPGKDFLRLWVDSEAMDFITGEQGWSRRSLALGPGLHLIEWTYEKDIVNDVGQDAAWLDWVTVEYTIAGTVVDTTTFGGVGGVRVELYDTQARLVTSALTQTDGSFVVGGLPEGAYYLRAVGAAQGYVNTLLAGGPSGGIPCLACDVTSGFAVSTHGGGSVQLLLPRAGSITGTTTDATTGSPLAGVGVTILDALGGTVGTGWTSDGSGRYVAGGIPAGSYRVQADTTSVPQYVDQRYAAIDCGRSCSPGQGAAVTVVAGGTTSGIDFALGRGGRISGAVRDSVTGNPIANAPVWVLSTAGLQAGTATTDATGAYQTNGLPSGEYYVTVSDLVGYKPETYDDVPFPEPGISGGTPIPVTMGDDTPGVDLLLEAGGLIAGTVTDADTGAPLAALVDVFDAPGHRVASVRAAPDGHYATPSLGDGAVYLVARGPRGYMDELYQESPCAGCDPFSGTGVAGWDDVDGIDFTLSSGSGSIAGHVTASTTGTPLANVNVYVLNAGGGSVAHATTDNNGFYRIAGGLPSGTYALVTQNDLGYLDELYGGAACPGGARKQQQWAPGCNLAAGMPVAVSAPLAMEGIDFSLSPGGRIAGTVMRPLAVSYPPVPVEFFNTSGAWVTTAYAWSDGTYETVGLPAGLYYAHTATGGPLLDVAYGGSLCFNGTCSGTTGAPIVVSAGVVTDFVNFDLEPLTTGVSGFVTDAATGAPLANVRVELYDQDHTLVAVSFSNATGNYASTGPLDGGVYFVRADGAGVGYVGEWYDDVSCPAVCDAASHTPVSVATGEVLGIVDFALQRGGSVGGRVTDALTGAPLTNVAISVVDANGGVVSEGSTTNGSGSYLVTGIPAGAYRIQASALPPANYVDERHPGIDCGKTCSPDQGALVSVAAGGTTAGIDFALTRGARISGTVRDAATGAPIAQAPVWAWTTSGKWAGIDATDSTGVYHVEGLPGGEYFMTVSALAGYRPETYEDCAYPGIPYPRPGGPNIQFIAVPWREEAMAIDMSLDRAGQITGVVSDADTGVPLAARVDVYDIQRTRVSSVETAPDGRYATTGISDGTFFVVARGSSGSMDKAYANWPCAGCEPGSGDSILMSGGVPLGVSSVDIALSAGGGSISGHVTDAADGSAIANVVVRVFNPEGRQAAQGLTDVNGFYWIQTGLPSGTYTLVTENPHGYVDETYGGTTCPGAVRTREWEPSCSIASDTPVAVTAPVTTRDIDFALSRGGRIAGTVTRPIPWDLPPIPVEIFDASGAWVTTTQAWVDGIYRTQGLAPGTYYAHTAGNGPLLDEAFGGAACPAGACAGTTGVPITVTAEATHGGVDFFLEGPRVLTITKSGTGTGRVTSLPLGIDCGDDCTGNFVDGLTPTLIATPDPGSRFVGWTGGGCSGTADCVVPLSSDQTVNAEFRQVRLRVDDASVQEGSSGQHQIQLNVTVEE